MPEAPSVGGGWVDTEVLEASGTTLPDAPLQPVKEEPAPAPEIPVAEQNVIKNDIKTAGITIDSSGKYTDRPYFQSQIDSAEHKVSNITVQIFDLEHPGQLKAFQDLKSSFADETSGKVPVREEVKYNEKTGGWKVYMEWATILFKLPQGLNLK